MLVFTFADGQRVTLRFAAPDENSPPPAQPPMPASASDGDDAASASFPETALDFAEDEPELWSARKTKFFLSKYADMKDLVGKTRALRYVIPCTFRFALCERRQHVKQKRCIVALGIDARISSFQTRYCNVFSV